MRRRISGHHRRRWTAAPLAALIGAAAVAVGPPSSALAYPRPGKTDLVSVDSSGHGLTGSSGVPAISDDGRFVAFESSDAELASDLGILLHDRLTGRTERVGSGLGGARSPSISSDGRFVAFESFHDVLHPDPPGGFEKLRDIFVYDRDTAATEQVSTASDGGLPDNFSYRPTISADGRFVAFASPATNLVPDDTNGVTDVFVKDRATGAIERASVSGDGAQGNGPSGTDFASITLSSDGRYVAFQSDATNLVAQDLNLKADVFLRDREMGTTERVSVASDGAEGDGSSQRPAISADGRFVAFDSWAVNLVPGDGDRCTYLPTGGPPATGTTCGDSDVFVHDRLTGTTERVSVTSDGQSGRRGPRDGNSWAPAITDDGRQIAFYSSAANLVPGDTNGVGDVFVHDRTSGTTERVSVASDGTEGDGRSDGVFGSTNPPAIGGGRFVAFRSVATNLDPRDTTADEDIFVRDRGFALGVNNFVIHGSGTEITASGWATFAGEVVTSADDPEGDGDAAAEPAGGDLVHASVTHRPEQEDLLVRLRVTSLPSLLLSIQQRRVNGGVGAPGVTYGITFSSGSVRYEVRGTRDPASVVEDGPPEPLFAPPDPHFALFRCEPACIQIERLSGAFGTTGNEVRFAMPLTGLGIEAPFDLRDVKATTSFRPRAVDAIPLDLLPLPDASILPPRVEVAITPASASEPEATFGTSARLTGGFFAADVDTSGLVSGDYLLWARGCLADICQSGRSTAFTVDRELVQTSLSLSLERVRGDFAITATLTDAAGGGALSGAEIGFSINDEPIGSAVTDEAGKAQLSVHSSQFGPHDVLRAVFNGDGSYARASEEITTRP